MRLGKQPEYTPVTDLQEMLREIYPETKLTKDGIFGEETQREVQRFQRENGLAESGAADAETWEAIVRAHEKAVITNREAEPLLLLLQPGQVLQRGSKNTHLHVVQGVLIALAKYYDEMPQISPTGTLDMPTAEAIAWFQERADLPKTGELDKPTWRHLAKNYRSIVGDGSGSYPVRQAKQEYIMRTEQHESP